MAVAFNSADRLPYVRINSRRLNGIEAPELSTPKVGLDEPVPFLRGTARITEPQLTWYGNTEETIENYDGTPVTPGVGQSGFVNPRNVKLLTDVMFVLGTGPNARLRKIYDGKKVVWSGSAGPGVTVLPTARLDGFRYDAATFFGGAYTQPKNLTIQKSIPVDVDIPPLPDFNGFAYIVLEKIDRSYDYSGLTFEVDHFANPLTLDAAVNVSPDGFDLNPMTLLVETLCSLWNEAGYNIGQFDVPALRAVAADLAAEGNFGTVLIRDADYTVEEFIQTIEDQTEGVFFESPVTGLLTFRLMRSDTVSGDSVLHITPDMVASLSVQKDAWEGQPLHARSNFTDRKAGYISGVVKARTSFATQANKQNAEFLELSLPFVNNRELAQKITSRALAISALPALEVVVEMDRHGAPLLVGDKVELTSNRYEFDRVPFYVRLRKDQQKTTNKVSVTLQRILSFVGEVIFPSDDESWVPEAPPVPLAPIAEDIDSMPYGIAVRIMDYTNGPQQSITFDPFLTKETPLMKVAPANKWQAVFTINKDQGADPNQTQIKSGNEYFAKGELVAAISRYEGFDNGVLDAINVRYPYVDLLSKGSGDPLPIEYMNDARNVYLNARLMIVGNEIMAPIGETTVTDGTRTVTYRLLARGLYDTVARDHPAGTPVWYYWHPQNEYVTPRDIGMNAFFDTSQNWDLFGLLANAKISDEWLDADWTPRKRFRLPTRPHDARINGARSTTPLALAVGNTRAVTWSIRPRWSIHRTQNSGGGYDPYDAGTERWRAQTETAPPKSQKWIPSGLAVANEYDWNAGEWNNHIVRLEDVAGIVYDLASVKHPYTATANVTIPAGVVNGPGRLWVAQENSAGSSDEFAKDWLPVMLSGGIDGLGYAYGRYYGGL